MQRLATQNSTMSWRQNQQNKSFLVYLVLHLCQHYAALLRMPPTHNQERRLRSRFSRLLCFVEQLGRHPSSHASISSELSCVPEASPRPLTSVLYDRPSDDQRRPSSDRTGYIISVFRVMQGDDRHSFERDWPSWTGESPTGDQLVR